MEQFMQPCTAHSKITNTEATTWRPTIKEQNTDTHTGPAVSKGSATKNSGNDSWLLPLGGDGGLACQEVFFTL